MPLWDYDAAGTGYAIGSKCWDYNAAGTGYALGKMWDYNAAGVGALVWQADEQIHPGTTPTLRSSADAWSGTWCAVADNTSNVGASGCAYTTINLTGWENLSIAFACPIIPTHGALMVGLGNFSAYNITGWPTITHGYGWDTIKTGNGIPDGYTSKLNINVSGMSGSVQVGCAATARSYVGANGRINITSIILT